MSDPEHRSVVERYLRQWNGGGEGRKGRLQLAGLSMFSITGILSIRMECYRSNRKIKAPCCLNFFVNDGEEVLRIISAREATIHEQRQNGTIITLSEHKTIADTSISSGRVITASLRPFADFTSLLYFIKKFLTQIIKFQNVPE